MDSDTHCMRSALEFAVVRLATEILGVGVGETPDWLMRPGRIECGDRWPLIVAIYRDLTGRELPEVAPRRERRKVDAVLVGCGRSSRILEIDEVQHFNVYRAMTLRRYANVVPLAFDAAAWIERSQAKRKLEGGRFGCPKPPLFPEVDGRHRQRAFRDSLCDILPTVHGFAPTLRVADFEVKGWIGTSGARRRLAMLLEHKIGLAAG